MKRQMTKVVVLRWGHRPQRDARLTSHVALVARAFGAAGMILSDLQDEELRKTVRKVTHSWGGAFSLKMGIGWKKAVQEWKAEGGIVVHLTAYGENIEISDVLERIRQAKKNVLVIVGSQKVPGAFFSEHISDFNVAIGNQPHSECASLAVFLDRFWNGEELSRVPTRAKIEIVPQKRGKKIARIS